MTSTQTRTFGPSEMSPLPVTANLGYVSNVEPTYLSPKSVYKYHVTPIQINGLGAAKNHKIWVCFQPKWFKYEFNANSLNNEQGNPRRVYNSNVTSKFSEDEKAMGILQALSGSEENFGELCAMLADIEIPEEGETTEKYCEEVTAALTSFFNTVKPQFGYTLQQKSEMTDEIQPDELPDGSPNPKAGKNIWKRTKYFELKKQEPFFYVTEKELKRQRKAAESSAKKIQKALEDGGPVYAGFKVTFDEDTPF